MKEPKHYVSVSSDISKSLVGRIFCDGQPVSGMWEYPATEEGSDAFLKAYQAAFPKGPWFVFDQGDGTFSEVGQPEVAPAPAPVSQRLVVLGTSRPTRGAIVVWYTLGDSQELWTTVRSSGGENYQQVTCWYCSDGSCRFQPNRLASGKPGKKDGAPALETVVVPITDSLAR